MTIVSTREFRANQSHYFGLAKRGEHVVLKSRMGNFRLTPESVETANNEPKRDVTAEICRGMKDWKEYLETGKSTKFRPAEELINELRNLEASRL